MSETPNSETKRLDSLALAGAEAKMQELKEAAMTNVIVTSEPFDPRALAGAMVLKAKLQDVKEAALTNEQFLAVANVKLQAIVQGIRDLHQERDALKKERDEANARFDSAVTVLDGMRDRLRDIIRLANGDDGPEDDEWPVEDAPKAVKELRLNYEADERALAEVRNEVAALQGKVSATEVARDELKAKLTASEQVGRSTLQAWMDRGAMIRELKAENSRLAIEVATLQQANIDVRQQRDQEVKLREIIDRERKDLLAWKSTEQGHCIKSAVALRHAGYLGEGSITDGIKDLSAKLATAREALESLLTASECADETGYVVDCGFVDVEAIQENAHKALAAIDGAKWTGPVGGAPCDGCAGVREPCADATEETKEFVESREVFVPLALRTEVKPT